MAKQRDPRGDNRTEDNGLNGGKWSKYRDRGERPQARWMDVDGAELVQAIDAITASGDAVVFGRSRDGGVLVLTVCYGNEREKFYAKTGAEMEVTLADLAEQARDAGGGVVLE